jgi:hypothetical protein
VAVPAPVPVAEPQTPPGDGSTEHEETEKKAGLEGPATNLNSAKAEAQLVKALDYLVSLSTIIPATPPRNGSSTNPSSPPSQAVLRPAIKKFVENHRSFIDQADNTHGLGPGHNRGKARTNPDAIPLLVKNFKGTPSTSPSNRSQKLC